MRADRQRRAGPGRAFLGHQGGIQKSIGEEVGHKGNDDTGHAIHIGNRIAGFGVGVGQGINDGIVGDFGGRGFGYGAITAFGLGLGKEMTVDVFGFGGDDLLM